MDSADLANPDPSNIDPSTMDPRLLCYLDSPQRTFELCGVEGSGWGYRPSHGTNLAFAVLFGLSLAMFLIQGLVHRRYWGFTIAMACGCTLEIIGYIARAQAHRYLWSEDLFLIQIVCLTIGPAFLAAGIYLCLSNIVTIFGPENSRIKPRSYPMIFILCDVISLVLQATGGGMASVETHNNRKADTGNHIMIAGLAFQVFTLLLFILLALDFAICTYRRVSAVGSYFALNQRYATLRTSWLFKIFLGALAISTLCIFTRCVYRVAELSQGWSGHLMLTQKYFVGLEGAVVVAAVLLLNLFHPGLCANEARDVMEIRVYGRTWYGRKRANTAIHGCSGIQLRDIK